MCAIAAAALFPFFVCQQLFFSGAILATLRSTFVFQLFFFCGRNKSRTCNHGASNRCSAIGAIRPFYQTAVRVCNRWRSFEDEERFELSTLCLTNTCSAVELFIRLPALRELNPYLHPTALPLSYQPVIVFVGPEGFEPSTPALKVRCICHWATNQFCTASRFELETITCYFPLRKKGKWWCCHYTKPYWLTPGFEPCSPVAQTGTLPIKLKPTYVVEDRLELSSPVSETGMLPLHHSTILRFVWESNS